MPSLSVPAVTTHRNSASAEFMSSSDISIRSYHWGYWIDIQACVDQVRADPFQFARRRSASAHRQPLPTKTWQRAAITTPSVSKTPDLVGPQAFQRDHSRFLAKQIRILFYFSFIRSTLPRMCDAGSKPARTLDNSPRLPKSCPGLMSSRASPRLECWADQ